MARILLLGFLLVILAGFVSADVEMDVQGINTSIFRHDSASYDLRIINQQGFEDRFQLSSGSARFVVISQPRTETVPIGAESFEEFLVYVNPKSSVGTGPYAVPIRLESRETGDIYTMNLALHIKDPNAPGLEYPPNPSLKINIPNEVDPREGVKLTLNLKNRNPRDLDELTIMIDGELLRKTYTTSLNGMEEKGNEMRFDLHPLERPGDYTVTVKVIFEGKVYAEVTKNFQILGYSDVSTSHEVKNELFKTTRIFRYKNDGNAAERVEKRVETNWLKAIFTSTDGELIEENGQRYYHWDVLLPARSMQEEAEIVEFSYSENYRVPVIILLLAIIGVGLYFFLRSPIVCQKNAFLSHREGVSHIKIKLFIKNRSRAKIHNISVKDRIPAIAEFHKTNTLGTMQPTRITKSAKKGTIIVYEMSSLEPFEERIITYDIKSKLKILGGMTIKPATVKYEAKKGIQRRVVSNEVKMRKR